jgi:exosome complex RNA-binding protein Rrp42 (RNase PH superfamily)
LEGGGGVASPSSSQATTALVRAGRTAALAGLRLEVAPAPPTGAAAADGGILVVTVEIPPISSGERREGGRLVGLAGAVRAGLERCVDLAALRIPSSAPPSPSPAAAIFVARLDIVLLSADGGELGVALAAGAAALAATAVPGVAVKGGRVVRVAPGPAAEPGAALNAAAAAATAAPPGAAGASRIAGLLTALPVAMSAGLWTGGRAVVVVDPDAEEEGLVDGLVSVVVGMMAAAHPPRPAGGVMPAASPPSMPPLLHAVFSGGPALAPPGLVVSTAGAARARGEEVRRVLVAALEQRG